MLRLLFLCFFFAFVTNLAGFEASVSAESEKTKSDRDDHSGPIDEYDRGNPRSSLRAFFEATRDGDYDKASEYLDMRNLPFYMDESQGPELARKLKILLDRTIRVDLELVSADPEGNLEDGHPLGLESIGRIVEEDTGYSFNILLQHVLREDGVYIWKFSKKTIANIPEMYRIFGYRPFEKKLSKLVPDFTFLGWHLWQWIVFFASILFSFLIAFLVTWFCGLLLRRKETEMRRKTAQLFSGPFRIIILFVILQQAINMIGPSSTVRAIQQVGTIWILAITWSLIRTSDLLVRWWARRMHKGKESEINVLLRPIRNVLAIFIILLAVVVWISNLGFNVSALLTGLGVGGIAVALAAQDTLKNFFASITILLDRPYQIGQRIVAKGHDGIVEEIGLRSTKLRDLNGHQTIIPNDLLANSDIENIGRRPHIRRVTNIAISTGDTISEKSGL